MRRWSVVVGALATAGIMIGLLAGPGRTEAQDKIVIKLGHHHNVGGIVDAYANKFAALMKQKTNGRVEVQVFPGAQLGQEGEAVEGVQLGTLQMTIGSSPFLDKYVKEMGTEQLPFLFDSWEHADRALNGPVGEELGKRLLAHSNVRLLSFIPFGFRDMFFRDKPVTNLKQFKGMKMRAPQAWIYIRMLELLGARPTTVTWGEFYTALQTGVVEGGESPPTAGADMKFYEVSKYWLDTNHMFASINHMVNKRFFDGLPKDVQAAILASAKEASAEIGRQARGIEDEAVKGMKARGIKYLDPEDREEWRKAVQPMYTEYVKERPGAQTIIEMIQKLRK
jgi:tripartite ATP-independent transporter DctP family solute receptor